MKKNKNILIALIIVVVTLALLFLLKGSIYSVAVKYEDAGGRKSYEVKDNNLANYINQSLPNDESLDENIEIGMIVDFSLEMTATALEYSMDATENDPQKTFVTGTANYIGYAAFTAAVGDYLIKRFELNKEWEVKPKKGKLYLFSNNKTKTAKEGWFKDHDFVVFRNKNTKEEIYVDPSAYEAYGTKRVYKYQK